MANRLREFVQSMRRGSAPSEASPDALADVDVHSVFAQAELLYRPPIMLVPIERAHDIPMTDENVARLMEQYGPSIVVIGRKLKEGGQIDMELVAAQVALMVMPHICLELSEKCFETALTFQELSGERKGELARFSLGRRGTDAQEREFTRRRRLSESLGGRLRLGTEDALGQLAGTVAQRLTRSGRKT